MISQRAIACILLVACINIYAFVYSFIPVFSIGAKSSSISTSSSSSNALRNRNVYRRVTDNEEKLVWDTKANRFYESSTVDASKSDDGFVVIDKETGNVISLTKDEKERIFLDAIQSYYFKGNTGLSDEMFDQLKDDLSWEGSALVTMNRNETLFINAMQAYNKGTPILTDAKWDELKLSLREAKSNIAVAADPTCYVDTGLCKATWSVDSIRTTSLYTPAALISTIGFVGVAYEALNLIGVTVNPLITLLIGTLPISAISKSVTENVFFRDPLVANGPCPNCGVDNRVFFGSVLGVDGENEESSIKCTNCKSSLTIKKNTLRVSTLLPKNKNAAASKVRDEE